MTKHSDVGDGKEFPTEWHREQHVRDLERELAGAETRGDDDYAKNVRAELKRLVASGGQKTAAKRPRSTSGKAKETR